LLTQVQELMSQVETLKNAKLEAEEQLKTAQLKLEGAMAIESGLEEMLKKQQSEAAQELQEKDSKIYELSKRIHQYENDLAAAKAAEKAARSQFSSRHDQLTQMMNKKFEEMMKPFSKHVEQLEKIKSLVEKWKQTQQQPKKPERKKLEHSPSFIFQNKLLEDARKGVKEDEEIPENQRYIIEFLNGLKSLKEDQHLAHRIPLGFTHGKILEATIDGVLLW
jgi:hypothetical protein